MSALVEKTKTTLEQLYKEKVNTSVLGFDIDDLTLSKGKVMLKDCTGCTQRFTVNDYGLEEDNVALFWRMCEKLDNSFYCAGYEKPRILKEERLTGSATTKHVLSLSRML